MLEFKEKLKGCNWEVVAVYGGFQQFIFENSLLSASDRLLDLICHIIVEKFWFYQRYHIICYFYLLHGYF